MHPGSDPMGAPPSFAARRPNAANLGSFELPPPSIHKYPSFNQVNTSQPSQASTTIASVGNLLTPPNHVQGEVISAVSGVSTSSVHSTQAMPQYSHHGQQYIYSPSAQAQSAQYGYSTSSQQQNSYNNSARGLPPPQYELTQQLPPFPPSSQSSLPTMSAPQQPQHMHGSMMNAQNTVSSAPQQSPVHAQEQFQHRPPPTPTYYNSQPSTTSQQPTFHQYSTGPSPNQQSPISAGGVPRQSPAISQGQIPSLPSAPSQSPHQYQRPFASYLPQAPVYSNVGNPNGQLSLVGGMPHGMVPGFNSGHAANMPHMFGHPQQQAQQNERPFKCDQCPQSFSRNHDLKRHKRIHLSVKPFPCGHCDKSFSRKDALKRHVLVKGCGKAMEKANELKRESTSPGKNAAGTSDSIDTKPVISSHA
ncbi:hypothetical protein GQ43DRAFT_128116 [Delitschia confertaspora ATCC 74209]|uniref:C2H2-type domain-containing protein n=1 Tax=Delitschia confertaspora ATCC 74209 TaxID=1513339 RepID=A0A9P4JJA8_9PLEO|nr:hypothetical protein GQ43DRAFT_128116 [Delitschia confertaspora ATCC 74209]